MAALFSYPELWLALLAILFLIFGAPLFDGARAKHKKRLERMLHTTAGGTVKTTSIESLRKQDPSTATPLGRMLAPLASVEKLKQRIERAGLRTTPQRFLGTVSALTLGTALLCILLGMMPLLALLVGIIVGVGGPHFSISHKIKKRQVAFLKLFPEGIDLIVRGLRAGLPVAESFNTVAREIPEPVAGVFSTISQQTALGLPMEHALASTAEKLDMTEFNFFVTTIILQRETGGNLGEVLSNLGEVLRDRQIMKLKITALSSEARASAYIVGALPFVVFAALSAIAPTYLDPLYDDYRGNMAVGMAFGMMFFGGFIMKRMTQFDI